MDFLKSCPKNILLRSFNINLYRHLFLFNKTNGTSTDIIWRWQVVLQFYVKYILHIYTIYNKKKTFLYIRNDDRKVLLKIYIFFFFSLWHTIYNFCHLSESVNVLMCMCICVCFEAIYAEYGGKDGNWRWVYNIDTIYLTMILILFIFYDFGK